MKDRVAPAGGAGAMNRIPAPRGPDGSEDTWFAVEGFFEFLGQR